ncbi:hypothetical protein BGZ47_010330 [Haplosporangium gracile]|nr:hypothetical protein BGZ47_010330 [Haplosporangium gracile]
MERSYFEHELGHLNCILYQHDILLAVAALALNWEAPSVYLKIFLVAFVVRKWVATLLMVDRALYRLPLNLTEPDPDIDEERHNGVAI